MLRVMPWFADVPSYLRLHKHTLEQGHTIGGMYIIIFDESKFAVKCAQK